MNLLSEDSPKFFFHIPLAEAALAEAALAEAALAEATIKLPADFDLQTARQKIQAAIDSTYPAIQTNDGLSSWNDIIQLTLSSVTWNNSGDIWQCTWELTDQDTINLGSKEKVKVTYVTAEAAASLHMRDEFVATLSESSTDDGGWNWKTQIIASGKTLTPNLNLSEYGYPGKTGYKHYMAEAVRDAAPYFENAPFSIRPVKAHLDTANAKNSTYLKPNEETRLMGGVFRNVSVAESGENVSLLSTLTLRDNPAGRAARKALLAESAKPGGVQIGLSYTGFGDCYITDESSPNPTLMVTKILQVDSVDACPVGNAGGMVIAAAEAALAESATSTNAKTPMKRTPKKSGSINLVAAKHKMLFKAAEAGVDTEEAPAAGASMGDTLLDFASNFIWKNLPGIQDIYDSVDDVKTLDEAKLVTLFQKADQAADAAAGSADDGEATEDAMVPDGGTAVSEAALAPLKKQIEQLQASNMGNLIEARLATVGKGLTTEAQDRIRSEFKGRLAEAAEVDTSIRSMKKLLGGVSTSSALAESIDFDAGENEHEKIKRGVMSFMFQGANKAVLAEATKDLGYDPSARENRMWTSFKDMYLSCIGATGLQAGAGFGQGARGVRGGALAESASAGILTQLIQDSMHHRMVNEYRNEGEWDFWRQLVTSTPVTDFRPYHDQHFGYTSNPMSIIAEDTDYPEIPLTGNEDVSTTLQERGGVFGIGWRAVLNDDVGFVIKIAPRIAMGAKKQLAKGVGDIYVNAFSTKYGPDAVNIIDDSGSATPGVATGTHKNYLGKAAINAAGQMSLAERLLAEQPELGSSEAMGLTPDYLLYAPYERQHAYSILTPGQGQLTAGNSIGVQGLLVATADQSIGITGIKVPYWTATTNAYFVVAGPQKVESVTALFLNGQQEPQIFQEVLNSGMNFTRKRMNMRVEHHWMTNCKDYRGITGGHVS